jgi:hypothetical protein
MRSILTGAILKFGNISEKKISPKASFVVRELTGSTLAEDLLNHV